MGQRYSSQNLHRPLLKQGDVAMSFGETAKRAAYELSADSQQFFDAWKTWRGTRVLPQRRDMDLVSIARLMPRMMLLEVFSPQRMVYRLAGGEVEAMLGMRLMGRDHIAIAEPEVRASRGQLLWTAAKHPCGVLTMHPFQHPQSGQMCELESLALPILPDNPEAPVQLLVVVSRIPALEKGVSTALPLVQRGLKRQFIDTGAGLPSLNLG